MIKILVRRNVCWKEHWLLSKKIWVQIMSFASFRWLDLEEFINPSKLNFFLNLVNIFSASATCPHFAGCWGYDSEQDGERQGQCQLQSNLGFLLCKMGISTSTCTYYLGSNYDHVLEVPSNDYGLVIVMEAARFTSSSVLNYQCFLICYLKVIQNYFR